MTYYNVQDSIYIATANSNVGIGITNPSKKLEVVGDIDTTTDYNINSTQVLSATTLGSGVVNSSLTSLGTQAETLNMGDNSISAAKRITLDSDSITNKIYLTRSDNSSNGFSISQSASQVIALNQFENANFNIKTNNTTRLTLEAAGDINCNSNDITNAADISFTSATIKGHMIPDTDDAYDIGSAEFKIRDLYVSDNSMWIGDTHKISISGGKMKFRKRKTTTVPASIIAAAQAADGSATESSVGSAAIAHASVVNLSAMKLKHWRAYMRTISGQSAATIQDIFRDNTADYSEESETNWLQSGTKTYNTTGNLGIGTSDPSALLSLHYDPESSQGLKELMRLSWNDANYDTLKGDGVKISFHQPDTNNFPGTEEAGYFGVMKANAVEADTESDITIANNDGTNMVERVRILSDGNVGIGDSTPSYKLDVAGDINLTGDLRIDGVVQTFGSSVWSESNSEASYMGNVGIGIANPAYPLDIYDTESKLIKLKRNSTSGGAIVIGNNTVGVGNLAGMHIGYSSSNDFIFYNFYNSDFHFHTNGTRRMVIKDAGNVGINNTSPSYKLDVAGDINLTGDLRIDGVVQTFGGLSGLPGDTRQGFVKTYTSSTGDMFGIEQVSSSQSGISRPEMRLFTSEVGTAGIGFGKYTNATSFNHQMVIDHDGNVGVGTTNPQELLHISGASNPSIRIHNTISGPSGSHVNAEYGSIDFWSSDTDTATCRIVCHQTGGGTAPDCSLKFYTNTNNSSTEKMHIDYAGNVGIGTTTPSEKLEVSGNIDATGYIRGKQHYCEIGLDGSTNSSSPNIYENREQSADNTWQYVYLKHTRTDESIPKVGNQYDYNRSFTYNHGFDDSNTNNSTSGNSPDNMYKIKCSVAGIYQFHYSLKMYNNISPDQDSDDSTEAYVIVQKNSTGEWYGQNRFQLPDAKNYFVAGSGIVRMSANDWLCVRVKFDANNASTSRNYYYDDGFFSCCMIGKV